MSDIKDLHGQRVMKSYNSFALDKIYHLRITQLVYVYVSMLEFGLPNIAISNYVHCGRQYIDTFSNLIGMQNDCSCRFYRLNVPTNEVNSQIHIISSPSRYTANFSIKGIQSSFNEKWLALSSSGKYGRVEH